MKHRKLKEGRRIPNEGAYYIRYSNGAKWYFLNGLLHREDGPAIEADDFHSPAYFLYNKEYFTAKRYWKKLYKLGKITKAQYMMRMIE